MPPLPQSISKRDRRSTHVSRVTFRPSARVDGPIGTGSVLPFERPVNWSAPNLNSLAGYARRLVESGKVRASRHASDDRMPERDLDPAVVLDIIRLGQPYLMEPGVDPGEWRVNFRRAAGSRDAAVAVSLRSDRPTARIITAMWLDRR